MQSLWVTTTKNDVFFWVLLHWQNTSRAGFLHCRFTDATCHRAGVQHAFKLHIIVNMNRDIKQFTESLNFLNSLPVEDSLSSSDQETSTSNICCPFCSRKVLNEWFPQTLHSVLCEGWATAGWVLWLVGTCVSCITSLSNNLTKLLMQSFSTPAMVEGADCVIGMIANSAVSRTDTLSATGSWKWECLSCTTVPYLGCLTNVV